MYFISTRAVRSSNQISVKFAKNSFVELPFVNSLSETCKTELRQGGAQRRHTHANDNDNDVRELDEKFFVPTGRMVDT